MRRVALCLSYVLLIWEVIYHCGQIRLLPSYTGKYKVPEALYPRFDQLAAIMDKVALTPIPLLVASPLVLAQ